MTSWTALSFCGRVIAKAVCTQPMLNFTVVVVVSVSVTEVLEPLAPRCCAALLVVVLDSVIISPGLLGVRLVLVSVPETLVVVAVQLSLITVVVSIPLSRRSSEEEPGDGTSAGYPACAVSVSRGTTSQPKPLHAALLSKTTDNFTMTAFGGTLAIAAMISTIACETPSLFTKAKRLASASTSTFMRAQMLTEACCTIEVPVAVFDVSENVVNVVDEVSDIVMDVRVAVSEDIVVVVVDVSVVLESVVDVSVMLESVVDVAVVPESVVDVAVVLKSVVMVEDVPVVSVIVVRVTVDVSVVVVTVTVTVVNVTVVLVTVTVVLVTVTVSVSVTAMSDLTTAFVIVVSVIVEIVVRVTVDVSVAVVTLGVVSVVSVVNVLVVLVIVVLVMVVLITLVSPMACFVLLVIGLPPALPEPSLLAIVIVALVAVVFFELYGVGELVPAAVGSIAGQRYKTITEQVFAA
jgi:hypothetical protein